MEGTKTRPKSQKVLAGIVFSRITAFGLIQFGSDTFSLDSDTFGLSSFAHFGDKYYWQVLSQLVSTGLAKSGLGLGKSH